MIWRRIKVRSDSTIADLHYNKAEVISRVAYKLFLRTDNIYYCYPWCTDENVVGAPILFYISSPHSIIGGMGYILERRIAFPEELFLRFGGIGVYKIPNIQNHTKKSGSNLGIVLIVHLVVLPASTHSYLRLMH